MLDILGAVAILFICTTSVSCMIYIASRHEQQIRCDAFEKAAKMMCQHCAAGIPRVSYYTPQKDMHVINGQSYGCPSVSLWLEAEKQ